MSLAGLKPELVLRVRLQSKRQNAWAPPPCGSSSLGKLQTHGGGVRGVLETGALVTREAGKVTRDRDVGAVARGRQEHPGRWCLTSPWREAIFHRPSLFLQYSLQTAISGGKFKAQSL